MIYPLRYYGDPILRRRAREVTDFGPELEQLAADMLETMHAADGVGLAAPQIGFGVRLFVAQEVVPTDDDDDDAPQQRTEHVLVNPVITLREGQQLGRDGCLSIPGLFVDDMPRDHRVEVEYQDLAGVKHSLSAEGYFAHVLQHEHDHLEGILFLDRLPARRKALFMEEHRTELAEMQREAKAFLKQQGQEQPKPALAGRR